MTTRNLMIFLLSLVLLLIFNPLVKAEGSPDLLAHLIPDWPQLPPGKNFGPTTGIGVDSKNNV